ncbi:hypothetical protein MGG_17980 [Pyricularia oryzae 70-15]|uniref:Uncharacterized protein n=1 Tax=Pyricularia oryzae (strain 70-15 / ATCC MYA-4617 / FGSC 8958) TaxID=242507 RepID=G4NJ71_PYRO7|nr:uncharacterized protein MGG_17980 [Pyricularia oryzae 70-15]EHA46287.1 hypothetical protein MGG_17980 [Pyricularia oryzae 70-15]
MLAVSLPTSLSSQDTLQGIIIVVSAIYLPIMASCRYNGINGSSPSFPKRKQFSEWLYSSRVL